MLIFWLLFLWTINCALSLTQEFHVFSYRLWTCSTKLVSFAVSVTFQILHSSWLRKPSKWKKREMSHFLLQCMKVKNESEVAQSCSTLSDAWTAAHQAPPSMGFSRQECWSGVSLPSPEMSREVENTVFLVFPGTLGGWWQFSNHLKWGRIM